MDSNNIDDIELIIKRISWNIGLINLRKEKAMSLNEFFKCSKEIRQEKNNLIDMLLKYKKIEQEQDLPVKLEYRSVLKKLGKK